MPALVILAAGMGSRYGGTKQVDPVGPHGQCILDYSIYDGLAAGFDKVVFVIRRDLSQAFEKFLETRYAGRVECVLAYQDMDLGVPADVPVSERAKPWGTGHAVLSAASGVDRPFCVINADDFYGRRAYEAMAVFLSQTHAGGAAARFSMVGFRLDNTLSESGAVSRGVCEVGPDGRLVSVVEHTAIRRGGGRVVYENGEGNRGELTGGEPVSLNFWGFTPDVFPALSHMFAEFVRSRGRDPKAEFFLPTAVDRMIRTGAATVDVLESPDRWVGVTYPADRAVVEAHIRGLTEQGVYPGKLW